MSGERCQNCQTTMGIHYCANCGEKRYSKNSLTLLHLFRQLFISVTDVDGKLVTSLRLLILRPGQLTMDYVKGIRNNRLNPFQVFLLANICYFFFISFSSSNTFTTPLEIHLSANNFIHKQIANDLVEQALLKSGESKTSYSDSFNQQIEIQSKSLIILMVPIFALFVYICFLKHSYLGVKSLVFSTHFLSFLLFLQMGVETVLGILVWSSDKFFSINVSVVLISDMALSLVMFISFWGYLFYSLKFVYEGNVWIIFFKSFLLSAGLYFAVLIYRMLLFFTTFYSLN